MRIVVLDQASKTTGWAVFDHDKLEKYGKIALPASEHPPVRFKKMCAAIDALINDETPDWVIIEEVALQTNVATLHVLSQLQGAIMQMCYERKIEQYTISPSSWRKLLEFNQGNGIKRPELKKQAIAYVQEHYSLSLSEDEADAVCIGAAFLKMMGEPKKIKGEQTSEKRKSGKRSLSRKTRQDSERHGDGGKDHPV